MTEELVRYGTPRTELTRYTFEPTEYTLVWPELRTLPIDPLEPGFPESLTPWNDWSFKVQVEAHPCQFCLEPIPAFRRTDPKGRITCPVCQHDVHPILSKIHREDFGRSERVFLLCLESSFTWNWVYSLTKSYKRMTDGGRDADYADAKDNLDEVQACSDWLWNHQIRLAELPGEVEDLVPAELEKLNVKFGSLAKHLREGRRWRDEVDRLVRARADFKSITRFQIKMVESYSWGVYPYKLTKAMVLEGLKSRL